MDYIEVVTTVETREDAQRIARILLEKHLAACVQIVGPITSMFRWQGEVERADEYRCQIKCRSDRFDRIERVIAEIHPYEVPEVVAHPLPTCSSDYEKWLQEELQD